MQFFSKKRIISGVLAAAIIFSGGKIIFTQENIENVSQTARVDNPVYLSTSTVPLRVSGSVSAAQSVVVYAQTAGVVTALPAREGESVGEGEVVVRQSTPVEDAQVALKAAEQTFTNIQQEQLVHIEKAQLQQASVRAYSATEIAALRTLGNDERVAEVSRSLQNSLEQSVLSAIAAVNYIHDHRSQFSAEGLALYETIVANLYGEIPNYFQGGVTRPVTSLYNIQNLLAETQTSPVPPPVWFEDTATILGEQLRALEVLFSTAESDMFDKQSAFAAAEDQAKYLEERSNVLAAQQSLNAARASFSQTIDMVLEEHVSLGTDIEVTKLDEEIASIQAQYAEKIALQADVVARAGKGVVEAAQSLGLIEAPFAGAVSKVHTEIGEYVTPGTPLVTLVGTGARELRVSVPSSMLSDFSLGQEFIVDGSVAGFVDRFSTVTEGNSGVVVIALLPEREFHTGMSLAGLVHLSSSGDTYRVPRRYIHFDTRGPFVRYKTGEKAVVEIVYDTGTELFVQMEKSLPVELVPATSISL